MSNVQALRLQPVETPALLSEALPDELFDNLMMKRYPVQIHYRNQDEYSGYCIEETSSEAGEIVISYWHFEELAPYPRGLRLKRIQTIYIHECAHRLIGSINKSYSHNGAFMALNLVLHMRAGKRMIEQTRIYDFKDDHCIKNVFEWALNTAHELAETEYTAEECARIVCEKYTNWREAELQAEELEYSLIEQLKATSKQLSELKERCFGFAIFACVIVASALVHFR